MYHLADCVDATLYGLRVFRSDYMNSQSILCQETMTRSKLKSASFGGLGHF